MKSTLIYILIVILCSTICYTLPAQSKEDINKLYADCQACLDNTGYTEKCSSILYNRLDSLLNATYQHLQRTLSKTKKQTLLNEEKEWLKKREVYFKKAKALAEQQNPPGTEITNTFIIDKKNEFIRRRILELINEK